MPKKTMHRFKLLAGQHVQADKSRPILDAEGKPTGRYAAYQTFNRNDVLESDKDLAAMFGKDKFESVGTYEADVPDPHGNMRTPGDPVPLIAATSPSVAPGGQVSTGFQASGRAATPEEVERIQAKFEGQAGSDADSDADWSDEDLEKMSASDLREVAKERNVNLHGAHSKAEILKALKGGK